MTTKLFELAFPNPDGYRDVDVPTVARRHGSTRIIDVREPDEFHGELGHVPGAELVPLATLEHAAAGWPREQELVVVCRSGARSARAARLLMGLGFTRVVNLLGGIVA